MTRPTPMAFDACLGADIRLPCLSMIEHANGDLKVQTVHRFHNLSAAMALCLQQHPGPVAPQELTNGDLMMQAGTISKRARSVPRPSRPAIAPRTLACRLVRWRPLPLAASLSVRLSRGTSGARSASSRNRLQIFARAGIQSFASRTSTRTQHWRRGGRQTRTSGIGGTG